MNHATIFTLAAEHIKLTGGNPDAAPIDTPTALREAVELAVRAAMNDAADAILTARTSGHESVVFITGNSHMPPLRAFGRAEDFWAATYDVPQDYPGVTPWEAYAEAFESTLSKCDVLLACPDYDNALYVVDLRRFEASEAAEDDNYCDLSDAWSTIDPS